MMNLMGNVFAINRKWKKLETGKKLNRRCGTENKYFIMTQYDNTQKKDISKNVKYLLYFDQFVLFDLSYIYNTLDKKYTQ